MKLLILDRDGVINEDSDEYIKSPDEWRAIPGSLEAIALLNQAGFTISVATNQSGIARGLYSLDVLNAIHEKMHACAKSHNANIDTVFYCPHGPDDHCDCRKPKTGLFHQIADHYQIQLNNTYAVGDSLRDLQAAVAVGCLPVLVKTGKGLRTINNPEFDRFRKTITNIEIPVYNNLLKFAQYLIGNEHAN